ncbi:MAG: hypothetical protein ACK4VN_07550 [Bacteroidales bacterium]
MISKKVFIVLLSGLLLHSLTAQDVTQLPQRPLSGELFNAFPQVTGSLFVQPDWYAGQVFLICGSVAYTQRLRYSGYLEELFWMINSQGQIIKVDKGLVKAFTIEYPGGITRFFEKKEIGAGANSQQIFLEVLMEGEHVTLYKHHRMLGTQTQNVTVHNRSFQQQVIEEKPVYYLSFSHLPELRRLTNISRRSVFSALPAQRKQLRVITSEYNLSLWKNEAALVRFLSYFDENVSGVRDQEFLIGKQ